MIHSDTMNKDLQPGTKVQNVKTKTVGIIYRGPYFRWRVGRIKEYEYVDVRVDHGDHFRMSTWRVEKTQII